MSERYWLVHPNGGKQLIDPRDFDIARLAEHVDRLGGQLVVETGGPDRAPIEATGNGALVGRPPGVPSAPSGAQHSMPRFEPPVSALAPLFRSRLKRIFSCERRFDLDMNTRPTIRVLGGYYRRRSLVRIYTHDRKTGRRPLEELFDTLLHEVAHHLEYTEPHSFNASASGRVRGRMHSRLFWRILGDLKGRWARLEQNAGNDPASGLV